MSDETQEQTQADEVEEAIEKATEAVAVQTNELAELAGGAATGEEMDLGNLLDVPVDVTVEVGQARMPLGQLVKLGPGSLVELERESHEPADILVNGKIVARGEIVTIERNYGVRITQVEG